MFYGYLVLLVLFLVAYFGIGRKKYETGGLAAAGQGLLIGLSVASLVLGLVTGIKTVWEKNVQENMIIQTLLLQQDIPGQIDALPMNDLQKKTEKVLADIAAIKKVLPDD